MIRREDRRRVSAENLRGSFEEPLLGGGKKTGDRDAGIVDAIFPTNEIVGRKGTVDVRERVIVNGVDLAEIGAHLAYLHEESRGQRREGDVGFLNVYALFAKRDE